MEIKYTEEELNSIDKSLLIKMFLNLQNQMETLTVETKALNDKMQKMMYRSGYMYSGDSEINIEYGDRFDAEDTKPYDYFSIQANLNWQKDQPVLGQINIVGRLAAKELMNNEKHYLSLGLYQHFDYYDSDTISAVSAKVPYKFCTPASVGGGLIYKRNLKRNWGIDGYAYLNAILLGGALSDYYQVDERIYNLASGYSSNHAFNITQILLVYVIFADG